MSNHVDLIPQEITVPVVVRNASPARLYEDALTREQAGVEVKAYPEGKHHLFHDAVRDEVIADLLAWLKA